MGRKSKLNLVRVSTECEIIGGGNTYTFNGFLHTLTDLIAKYEAEFEDLAHTENGDAACVSVFLLLFRVA